MVWDGENDYDGDHNGDEYDGDDTNDEDAVRLARAVDDDDVTMMTKDIKNDKPCSSSTSNNDL